VIQPYTNRPLTMEEREQVCDALCNMIRQWIMSDPNSRVEFDIEHGVTEYNYKGYPILRHNGTATFTLRINGGAMHLSTDEPVEVE
jgi:hypothetical protein